MTLFIVLGTYWYNARVRKQQLAAETAKNLVPDATHVVFSSTQDRAPASPAIPAKMRAEFTPLEREDLLQVAMTLAGYGPAMRLAPLQQCLMAYPSLRDWYWNYVAGFRLCVQITEGVRDFDKRFLNELSEFDSIDELLDTNALLLFLVYNAPHLHAFYHDKYKTLDEEDKANGLKFDVDIEVVLNRLCALREYALTTAGK
jgi:hypothetical protein